MQSGIVIDMTKKMLDFKYDPSCGCGLLISELFGKTPQTYEHFCREFNLKIEQIRLVARKNSEV